MPTLLLVEDEAPIRNLLVEFLEERGHRVVAVPHGRQALQWLRQGEASCSGILTDITMPEMDGLELLAELRNHWPSLPVIAMTGYTDNGYLTLAQRMGAKAVLTKPFRLQDLDRILSDVLG